MNSSSILFDYLCEFEETKKSSCAKGLCLRFLGPPLLIPLPPLPDIPRMALISLLISISYISLISMFHPASPLSLSLSRSNIFLPSLPLEGIIWLKYNLRKDYKLEECILFTYPLICPYADLNILLLVVSVVSVRYWMFYWSIFRLNDSTIGRS